MIETENLTRTFGSLTAVNRVNLRVEKREIFGVAGPDGAGKTTLLRMFCGIIVPTSGRVIFSGGSGGNGTQARPALGYMPQRFSLYGDLTVLENVNFYGALYGLNRKATRQKADEFLRMTGLIDFKHRFTDNLSGGMKQKLALVCALLAGPEMLILDEPTYGVDPEYRKEFWKLLYRLNREGVTIIVSTPYMDEAELCQRVAFMDRGVIVAVDTPDNLKKKCPYRILEVKAEAKDLDFLGALPDVIEAWFYGDRYHLAVREVKPAKEAVTALLAKKGINLLKLDEIPPSMEDVFVSLAGKEVV
ncbi:MAG: ABC transporter ATP-binding protein [Armatimonadetes bacterium]|nr:ABC transporter ATP-binding protein [Armatimonadota bacterium]